MDFKKLSEVAVESQQNHQVTDSARQSFLAVRKKLIDSVKTKDRKTIIDAAVDALKDNAPETVIKALVSLLGKKDSVKRTVAEIRDSESYKTLKQKIKDEMAETESTEDAIEVVHNALENADPQEVAQAAVEIMAETIDLLEAKLPAAEGEGAGEGAGEGEGEDFIEDSVTHKGKKKVQDSFHAGEAFEGNGLKGKIKEVKEDAIVVETTDEEGNVEDKEVKIADIC